MFISLVEATWNIISKFRLTKTTIRELRIIISNKDLRSEAIRDVK